MKLLSFGEIIWDVFSSAAHLGGAPLNFAAHMVLQGGEASILSAVGEDELGREALRLIAELGVGTECVGVVCDRPTGQCVVTLDENSVPTYDIRDDTAYDYISANESTRGFDVLAFGTLSLRHEHNRATLRQLIEGLEIEQPKAIKESEPGVLY